MTPMRKVQLIVTIGALAAALAHVLWPDIAIDSVTIALLTLAAIPWLVPLFKSLETPGGWKFEFQDLEKTTEKAKIAGLVGSAAEQGPSTDTSAQLMTSQDPILVLVELRIEIERRLDRLATAGGLDRKFGGYGYLLHDLVKHGLLTPDQGSIFAEITEMLNAKVRAPVVDYLAVKWAVDIGPDILQRMDRLIEHVGQE